MQDTFADIRPYEDHEVAQVLKRLLSSKTLRKALIQYFYPNLPRWMVSLMAPIVFHKTRQQLIHTHSVDDFQLWLVDLLTALLKRSTTNIEVRGLENLIFGQSYVWISNHRDIAMDPLLMNYSLFAENWPTSRIAIGDNLLSHPDVADIMRLNKSFVVKRNISNKREKLNELKRLSAYIRYSIEQQYSVWIAQREGRAKDGIDKTDTAVLKMLALHGRELNETFTDTMLKLRPVPVSIQYEWDPCDVLKARELVAIAELGRYQKSNGEDTRSILLGMTGDKGRVIVSFGRPLNAEELSSADTMAHAIDSQITAMTEILPVQKAALALLQKQFEGYEQVVGGMWDESLVHKLVARLAGESIAVQERVLKTYAAPLMSNSVD